jgi:hypothetical protein
VARVGEGYRLAAKRREWVEREEERRDETRRAHWEGELNCDESLPENHYDPYIPTLVVHI